MLSLCKIYPNVGAVYFIYLQKQQDNIKVKGKIKKKTLIKEKVDLRSQRKVSNNAYI